MAITLTSEQPLISYTCLFKSSALHDHDLSLLVYLLVCFSSLNSKFCETYSSQRPQLAA